MTLDNDDRIDLELSDLDSALWLLDAALDGLDERPDDPQYRRHARYAASRLRAHGRVLRVVVREAAKQTQENVEWPA